MTNFSKLIPFVSRAKYDRLKDQLQSEVQQNSNLDLINSLLESEGEKMRLRKQLIISTICISVLFSLTTYLAFKLLWKQKPTSQS